MVCCHEGGGIACGPVGRGCVVGGDCDHACLLQTWMVIRLVISPSLACFLPV
uniref:Uncharacterized protein n=1 Tax=Setaria italica TaxID=4555 RepID=K3Y4J9_SETIT